MGHRVTRLHDMNSRDLLGAIRLGCRTMERVFDADDPRGVAFFDAVAWPEPRLSFSPVHSEAHVPGRHLNALLAAEGLLGIEVDTAAVDRHANALFFAYSGDLPLPLNRVRRDGALGPFCPHNLREGFHGLAALARWRGSERAVELARRSVALVTDTWRPPNDWTTPVDRDCASLTHVQSLGRAIGPLVKLWRTTGEQPFLDLAARAAEAALDAYPPDGAFRAEVLGTHSHSVTSALSSLALLADATADADLLARVRAFSGNGLWTIRDQLGWVIESTAPDANPDKGETNSSGDIVETGLILAAHGDHAAAEDVERIVRAHILPSQLRDVSWIPSSAGTGDGTTDVAERLRGAWGFPAPYGHHPLGLDRIKFNLDIVGGTTASLVEVAESGRWTDEPAPDPIEREIELPHGSRTIQVRLRGHEVVAMGDVGADLTFFPPLDVTGP
jgi:hypothetical protein